MDGMMEWLRKSPSEKSWMKNNCIVFLSSQKDIPSSDLVWDSISEEEHGGGRY